MAKRNDKCFFYFTVSIKAAMLVSLRISIQSSINLCETLFQITCEFCTDLNGGKVVYISIIQSYPSFLIQFIEWLRFLFLMA